MGLSRRDPSQMAFQAVVLIICLLVRASSAFGEAAPGARGLTGDDAVKRTVPDVLCWEPEWRERNDCGPLCLFFFLSVLNRSTTLAAVKRAVNFDGSQEQGCSFESLRRAAIELGQPAEIRFVNPLHLRSLPGPYILHEATSLEEGVGHYLLIIGYDRHKGSYAAINEARARFDWFAEDAVLRDYSGYVLVPTPDSPHSRRYLSGAFLAIGASVLVVVMIRAFARRTEK